MFFTLVKDCNANTILEVGELSQSYLSQIASQCNFTPDNIVLCSPNYKKSLTPDEEPFEIEPNLKLNYRPQRFPPPPYYLLQNLSETPPYFCVGVNVKTQTDIEFPKIFVPLTKNECRSLPLEEFIHRCSEAFGYDNSEQEIYIADVKCEPYITIKQMIRAALENKLIFKTLLTQTELRPIQHRIYLCEQLVESEEFYINTLDTMTKYWEPNFKETKMFTEEEMKELFRLIPTMKEAHQSFLNALKASPISFAQTVCDTFLNYIPYFKVSNPFISNYRSMDKWYQEKLKDKEFGKKYLEIESKCPDDTGRSFSQYCVSPIQRYPKYNLLLRDMDKKTPAFHPDKRYLQYTLQQLAEVIGQFNINSLRMDQTYLMNQIQKELGSSFKLITPRRNLIMSCAVNFEDMENSNGFFHLFNDIYLITTQNDRTQTVISQHPLYELKFLEKGDSLIVSSDIKHTLKFKQPAEIQRLLDHMITVIPPTLSEIRCDDNYIAWTVNETDNLAMTKHIGAVIGNKIFWIGGRDAKDILSTEYVSFDTTNNEWQRVKCPLPPRQGHSVGVIGNTAYVLFGKTYDNMATDLWKFNGETEEWSEITISGEFPTARWGQSCVVWRNKLVFFGGMTTDQKFLNTVTIYDPQENTMSQIETKHAPIGRCFHGAVMIDDDRMMIVGGNAGKMFPSDFDILDLNTKEWCSVDTPKEDMKIIGVNFNCLKYGRFIYVFGGSLISTNIAPFAIDTITMRSFKLEQFGNSPDAHIDSAFALKDSIVYMFGGKESLTCSRNIPLVYQTDLRPGQRDIEGDEPVFIIPPTSNLAA